MNTSTPLQTVLTREAIAAGGTVFHSSRDDTRTRRRQTVILPNEQWEELGRPKTITVVIHPSDGEV